MLKVSHFENMTNLLGESIRGDLEDDFTHQFGRTAVSILRVARVGSGLVDLLLSLIVMMLLLLLPIGIESLISW